MDDSSRAADDAIAKINDEVSVGEDLGFQRSWWKFERGIWWFFSLLILLDLAGVFGRGPVAKARLTSGDQTFAVQYERIQRTGTPSLVTITFGESAVVDGHIELFVSDSLLSKLGTQRVIPEPKSSIIGGGGIAYTFPAHPPATVRFELKPVGAGVYPFRMVSRGSEISTRVWVMP